MALYLNEVTRHTDLMEKQTNMIPGSQSDKDMNWMIRRAEMRIDEARKAFLKHRASHPSK